jgi:hypothetical protein
MRLIRALALLPPAAAGMAQTAAGKGDFVLVFADEFNNGSVPSSANWTIETGYGPNNKGWGNKEFFLILNVAMGGTLGSGKQPPDPARTYHQTMLVDYVRVFQSSGPQARLSN